MLTLSAALTTTQKLASREPNIKVVITEAEAASPTVATYYTGYHASSRVRSIEHTESAQGGEMTKITLFDGDQSIASKDWTGRRVAIFYGYNSTGNGTGAKSEDWHERAPLWVITHEEIREEGYQDIVLTCGDIWWYMAQYPSGGTTIGDVPTYRGDEIGDYLDNASPKGVLTHLVPPGYNNALTSATITDGVPLTIDDSDGLVDSASYQIDFEFEWGTTAFTIVQAMLAWTEGGLRMRKHGDDMRFEHLDVDESVTYTFGTTHEVEAATRRMGIVFPNEIIVTDVAPMVSARSGASRTYTVTASDSTSAGRIGKIAQLITPPQGTKDSWSSAKAQKIADAILHQNQQSASVGYMITKPHIGLEVHDRITINYTSISGWSFTGFVTQIKWIYVAKTGTFLQEVQIGGSRTRLSSYLIGQSLINPAAIAAGITEIPPTSGGDIRDFPEPDPEWLARQRIEEELELGRGPVVPLPVEEPGFRNIGEDVGAGEIDEAFRSIPQPRTAPQVFQNIGAAVGEGELEQVFQLPDFSIKSATEERTAELREAVLNPPEVRDPVGENFARRLTDLEDDTGPSRPRVEGEAFRRENGWEENP